ISKVRRPAELADAVAVALGLDRKILVERGVTAREIEVSVLGNDHPEASVPGEIRPGKEWYDYEAKYTDGIAEVVIPAPLSDALVRDFQRLAVAAFRAVDAAGRAPPGPPPGVFAQGGGPRTGGNADNPPPRLPPSPPLPPPLGGLGPAVLEAGRPAHRAGPRAPRREAAARIPSARRIQAGCQSLA